MNEIIENSIKRHNPSGIHTALQLGACKGEEADFYQRLGVNTVVWVEANPALANGALLENLNKSNITRNIIINRAVTDKDGDTVTLNVVADDSRSNEGASSIMKPTLHETYYPGLITRSTVDVKTITVNTIASRLDSPVDFIAMDIQGAELLALQGAHKVLSNDIALKTMLIEIATEPLYVGATLVYEIDKYLLDYDFIRQDTFMMHKVWGDALYVRR